MTTKLAKLTALTLICASTTLSCSKDSPVLPQRDLEGTAVWYPSSDQQSFGTFWKPAVGYVADPMPFYDEAAGEWKIMYLQDFRPNQVATYHPFWGVSTRDAASYTSLGELLPCGGAQDQDAALGTGSVIYNPQDKLYYVFYTGNKYDSSVSGYPQAVMYATSSDFKTWNRCRSFLLTGAQDAYSPNDFRDPHVFADDEGLYHMVISTYKGTKGVLAEYVSSDLRNWEHRGVFMEMMWDRFYECPDVFKMGDWWYLVYSEIHSAVRKVQYFKGRTLEELKACTANDAGLWPDYKEGVLDSRGFYAGKTASNGTDRYIWGWCADRPGSDNTKVYDWGGALVCHKIRQKEDGTLVLAAVPAIESKFAGKQVEARIMGGDTESFADGKYSLAAGSYALFSRLGICNSISFTATPGSSSDRFSVSFSRGTDSEKWYSLVFNPESGTMMKINFEEDGGQGFIDGSDSYLFPVAETYDVTIHTDNSVLTMYVNDALAYTCRIYGLAKNPWSLNCLGGTLEITGLNVAKY